MRRLTFDELTRIVLRNCITSQVILSFCYEKKLENLKVTVTQTILVTTYKIMKLFLLALTTVDGITVGHKLFVIRRTFSYQKYHTVLLTGLKINQEAVTK